MMLTARQYAELCAMYSTPDRHYHNMTHVLQNNAEVMKLPPGVIRDRVEAANWYHDCYYDIFAAKGESERISAQFMLNHQADDAGCIPDAVYDARHIIAYTARHTEDLYDTICESANTVVMVRACLLMLDIDLISLADSWVRFKTNSINIRKEFQPIIDIHGLDVFLNGRLAFLQAMLAKKKIYYTDEYAHLEAPARRNIISEIGLINDEKYDLRMC